MPDSSNPYEPLYQAAAKEWNLDPNFLKAMALTESSGNPNAVSSKGASGLTGIMPQTGAALGMTDPSVPAQQIYAGAKYLSQGLDTQGSPERALLFYHGGPDWQHAYGPESQGYVPAVTAKYKQLTAASNPVEDIPVPPIPPSSGAPKVASQAPATDDVDDFLMGKAPAARKPAASAQTIAPTSANLPSSSGAQPQPDDVDRFLLGTPATPAPIAASPPTASAAAPTVGASSAPPSILGSIGAGIGRAAHDMTDVPAQLLARGADAVGLTNALNQMGVGAPTGAQATAADQTALQNYNQQYGNDPVATTARIGGQVAATLPMLASGGAVLGGAGDIAAASAGRVAPILGDTIQGGVNLLRGTTQAGGVLGRGVSLAANGALQGGAGAALTAGQSTQPVSDQMIQGAELGGAAGPLVGMVGSGFNALTGGAGGVAPAVARLAQTARDTYGIPITAPQMSGNSFIRAAADQSSKLPFSGAGGAIEAQRAGFQSALARELGENAPAVTSDVMDNAARRNAQQFNDIASRTNIGFGANNAGNLANILHDASRVLPDSEVRPLATQIADIQNLAAQNNGVIPGDSYQALTRTNAPLDRLTRNNDSNIAHYGQQIRNELDSAFQASASPADQAALTQARYQWRVMKTLQPLVEKSTDDTISPAQLLQQVRNASSRFDGSTGGIGYTGGGALGDLGKIGNRFLGPQADSNTANREAVNRLVLGSSIGGGGIAALLGHPLPAAGMAAGLLANRGANSALNSGFLANRLINSSLNPGANSVASNVVLPALTVGGNALSAQQQVPTMTIRPPGANPLIPQR